MRLRAAVSTVLAGLLIAGVIGVPFAYYRASYAHAKRFRVVTEGRVYRSGQFTAAGLRDIVANHNIRTVLNLQHENTDPKLPETWMSPAKFSESELCRQMGLRYVQIDLFELLPPNDRSGKRPTGIDQVLALFDDPDAYPILVHCKAGLHRTGRVTAIYRMEFEGWSPERAVAEMKANGYGDFMCTDVDEYLVQYVARYRPGQRYPVPPPSSDIRPAPIKAIEKAALAPAGGRP
jgi:hypothetical protein